MRVQLGADGSAQRFHVLHHGLRAERGACDEVGVTADVLRQGVQRNIRAVFDRPLKHGAEQRVVARDEGSMALRSADRVGDTAHHRDVHQPVGGIRRAFR